MIKGIKSGFIVFMSHFGVGQIVLCIVNRTQFIVQT